MAYLEGELLIEGGVEGLPVDFGLKLFLLVGQQVDLDVGVGGAAHVHGGQLCSLDDSDYELQSEEGERGQRLTKGRITSGRRPGGGY